MHATEEVKPTAAFSAAAAAAGAVLNSIMQLSTATATAARIFSSYVQCYDQRRLL
jgi:hypothetical protein